MADNRRAAWLAGLLVLVALGAVWYSFGGGSSAAPGSSSQPARTQNDGAGPGVASVDVHLDALKTERDAPEAGRRNPFEFQARNTPRADAPDLPVRTAPSMAEPTGPVGPAPPPPIALKFIGVVERENGTKVAVLSGAGYTVYGTEGESVDGRYRIVRIGVESLEMAYLDGRGQQTIRLTGQ